MRSRIITGPNVNFEEFFIPFTSTLSLNWPYSDNQVLAEDPDDPTSVKMTAGFESHLRDIRNWTLGPSFCDIFPNLIDQDVGIRDVGA